MEVFNAFAPMILAVVFVYTAATFASEGIRRKDTRKISIIGAIIIELISFTIWIPSLNDIFMMVRLEEVAYINAMIFCIVTILIVTIILTLLMAKKEKT